VETIRLQLVIDRIEENKAVLLVRPDEKREIYWPQDQLPEGIKEGQIINVEIEVDEEATKKAEERVSDLIQRLKKRSSNSKET